jgi:hypothetical protein
MNPTSQIEWVPVEERLPAEKGRRHLVASPGAVLMATWEEEGWVDVAVYKSPIDGVLRRYLIRGVTHWAELPEVPN